MWIHVGGWLRGRMPPGPPAAGMCESSPTVGAVGTIQCMEQCMELDALYHPGARRGRKELPGVRLTAVAWGRSVRAWGDCLPLGQGRCCA